ncbi:ComF family protein [bacterium]|nr:ComF family protein [bacterium]MCP5462524.1 ComF family protein [bacterium]
MIDISQFFHETINVFFPHRCQISGDYLSAFPLTHLNQTTYAELFSALQLSCSICGKPANDTSPAPYKCPDCRNKPTPPLRFMYAGKYDGTLKNLLHLYKYQRNMFLADLLGKYMVAFLSIQKILFKTGYECIIPVPLAPAKLRERGFNQIELIAKYIAQHFGIPANTTILRRKNHRFSQTSLDRSHRLLNLKDIFYLSKKGNISGKNIILLDDVRSTGSTLYYASHALFEGGAQTILTLTLANNE